MISEIIEARPEELRGHLEEAAGISKYKERRKETESRIKATRENLDRLSDVREEVDKQLEHLKRQAKRGRALAGLQGRAEEDGSRAARRCSLRAGRKPQSQHAAELSQGRTRDRAADRRAAHCRGRSSRPAARSTRRGAEA